MRSRRIRIVPTLIGVVFALVGLLWTGQGAGLIGGGMSGDRMWLWIGLVLLVLGVVLIVRGVRPAPPAR